MLNDVPSQNIKLDVQKLVELPAVSPVVDKLLDAIGNDDVSIESLSHLIEQDPALLGRIIGLANSAYFGQPEPITSAEEAIFKALGLRLTRSLALSIALAGPFQLLAAIPGFDLKHFWLRSVFTATMVQALCPKVQVEPRPGSDECYLAGMLHNFGLLPLIHLYPEQVAEAFRLRETTPELSLGIALQQVCSTDHHEVGAWLANKWHIPENITTVIRHFADYNYKGDDYPLVLLIHAAAEWADSYCQTDDWQHLPDSAKAAFFELGISAEQVNQIQSRIHKKREMIEAMASVLALA